MENQRAAITRRLSDPDFQATLVAKSVGLVLIMALLLIAFLIHDAYLWINPPKPKYFIVDETRTARLVTPVDSPILDDSELLAWTVKSVLAAYNVNYHDYPEQYAAAARHFTTEGWSSFAASYTKAGNYEAMLQARLLCFAQAERAAIIRKTAIIRGSLVYDIQLPIVQTCQNTQQQSSQHLMITVEVVRLSDDRHPEGIAIAQLVATAH